MNVLNLYIYIYIYVHKCIFNIYIYSIYILNICFYCFCCLYCIYICTYQPGCVVALLSVVVDCCWLLPKTHSCKTDVFTTHRCLHVYKYIACNVYTKIQYIYINLNIYTIYIYILNIYIYLIYIYIYSIYIFIYIHIYAQ